MQYIDYGPESNPNSPENTPSYTVQLENLNAIDERLSILATMMPASMADMISIAAERESLRKRRLCTYTRYFEDRK